MSISIVKGVTPDGRVVTLRLNDDGSLAISGASSGGTTEGNATAANQNEQTALLEELRSRVNATGLLSDAPVISEPVLTAVGSTPARSMAGYSTLTYQFDVTGVGTDVVVRAEGNLIGSTYINLSTTNKDITITSNGSYLITFEGKINNVRFTLVSFAGGTPNVTAHLLRGN